MSALSQFFSGGDKLVPVEIFAVGGGGGGSAGVSPSPGDGLVGGRAGNGGGAGLVLHTISYAIVGKEYTIIIGAGGASSASGSLTSIAGLNVYAYGGGAGGSPSTFNEGSSGGLPSAVPTSNTNFLSNLSSISISTPDSYQFAGNGDNGPSSPAAGRGGGGGGAYTSATDNNGGNGIPSWLIGYNPSVYGGGGGGGGQGTSDPTSLVGTGGTGGGGNGGTGGIRTPVFPGPQVTIAAGTGASGTQNTGGGGGGGGGGTGDPGPIAFPGAPGGTGGSGVIILRYPTAFDAATVTGNSPTPAQPGYHVYRWNSGPATITFN